jgi:NADH:ubiquinone oxidoreductase subunit 4 (subunit M)
MIANALSVMIAVPLIGAVISLFAGSKAKFVALITSLITLVLSLQMYMQFDSWRIIRGCPALASTIR